MKVWAAVSQDYDSERTHELYQDRDSAMAWLKRRWQEARRDEARTYEYWVRDYTEKALSAGDDMKAYYEEKATNPDVPVTTDIKESGDYFAEFRDGYGRHFVQERKVIATETEGDE